MESNTRHSCFSSSGSAFGPKRCSLRAASAELSPPGKAARSASRSTAAAAAGSVMGLMGMTSLSKSLVVGVLRSAARTAVSVVVCCSRDRMRRRLWPATLSGKVSNVVLGGRRQQRLR